jgi:crotonobetainyl-CoA:carnitine CoA-transferase CaiB-like acyl-CoA transferase
VFQTVPLPRKPEAGAMDGVRVLDIATFIAAPHCATILGEFGAEVIKVEHPNGGDPWRRYGTPSKRADSSLAWLTEARNKQSISLDLRSAKGKELFLRLVGMADVVCENFRPGTLEKWGLGYDVLSEINPRLILMRVSGYGQTGPYRDRPGFARIAHGVGGLTHLAGMPGGPPVTPGSTSLGDYMTGMYGAIAVLMALREVEAGGLGQQIDMALYESVYRVLDELVPAYAATGKIREREGMGTLNACPHGHFECGDGKWIAVACTSDKMFERLCHAMDRLDLIALYGKVTDRLAGRDAVDALVSEWTVSMSREDVLALCVASEVPAGAINSVEDIFNDPQFAARENLVTLNEPDLGPVTVPGVMPKLSRTPGALKSLGPAFGSANDKIYGGLLGLTPDDIAALKKDGVI